MTTHLTDDELAARVRGACTDRAARVVVEDRPFALDLAAAPMLADEARPPRRGRWLAVAAALALVATGVGVVALRSDREPEGLRSASTTAPVPAGPVWLVPPEPPLGLQQQSIAWRDAPEATGRRAQLFSPPGGEGRVLVLVSPVPSTSTALGTELEVRGLSPAFSSPSKDDGDRSTTLSWNERERSIEARYVGMEEAQALALLDGLTWRSDQPIDGFAPPPAEVGELVNEARPGVPMRSAELTYADAPTSVGPGVGTQVQLHTTVADEPTLPQLEAQLLADEVSVDPPWISSYDDEFGTLTVAWPEAGRTAWIDANQTDVSAGDLRRIADSLIATGEDGMVLLRDTEDLVSDEGPTTEGPSDTQGSSPSETEGATTTSIPEGPERPQPELPDLELSLLDGGPTTSLRELTGGQQAVVLVVASWCTPCEGLIELMSAMVRDGVLDGGRVVAVTVDEDGQVARAWTAEHGPSLRWVHDADGAVVAAAGTGTLPTVIVLGSDGSVEQASGSVAPLTDEVRRSLAPS